MPRRFQRFDQRPSDEAGRAGQQDAHARSADARDWPAVLRRAIVSGSVASIASTLAITLCSGAETRFAAAGTNATSHWIWRGRAKRSKRFSLRHTVIGYAIHHCSSVFWASVYERWFVPRETRCGPRTAGSASAVALLAFVVDYAVVPPRLNPGFEKHFSPRSMFATYAAFGAGLAAATCWRRLKAARAGGEDRE